MFSYRRVWAVVYRHLLALTDPFESMSTFFWIFMDLLLFGYMGKAFQANGQNNLILITLTNVILYYLFMRSAIIGAQSCFRDLEDLSFIGVMSTSINLLEWLMAFIIIGLIGAIVTFFWAIFIAWLCFGYNILGVGFKLLPSAFLMFFSGVTLFFMILSTLMMFGKKAHSLMYMLGWIPALFSGAIYPVTLMPNIAQKIAKFLPMYFVFNTIRNDDNIIQNFIKSFSLNLFYFIIFLYLFLFIFKKRKERGLVELELSS